MQRGYQVIRYEAEATEACYFRSTFPSISFLVTYPSSLLTQLQTPIFLGNVYSWFEQWCTVNDIRDPEYSNEIEDATTLSSKAILFSHKKYSLLILSNTARRWNYR